MSWRAPTPIVVVILLVGVVMVSTALAIAALAIIATVREVPVRIPQELATVCISSLTALGGLLTPSTGMTSGRADRAAQAAGHAAATAVVEHQEHEHDDDTRRHGH